MKVNDTLLYGICMIGLGIFMGCADPFVSALIFLVFVFAGLICTLCLLHSLFFGEKRRAMVFAQLVGFTLTGFLISLTILEVRSAMRFDTACEIIEDAERYKTEHKRYPESLRIIHHADKNENYWYRTDSLGVTFKVSYVDDRTQHEYSSKNQEWFKWD